MRTRLQKNVGMKAMTKYLVYLKTTVNRVKTEKSLLMKRKEELLPCSSQKTTSGGRITGTLLNHILSVCLVFAYNVKRASLRSCSREVSVLALFIFDPIRKWKRRSEELEENGNHRERKMMLARSIPFLE